MNRFNPCKGFGVIEAGEAIRPRAVPVTLGCFNPCKGFGVIGAPVSDIDSLSILRIFNPCKGFGVIGAVTHTKASTWVCLFQSL